MTLLRTCRLAAFMFCPLGSNTVTCQWNHVIVVFYNNNIQLLTKAEGNREVSSHLLGCTILLNISHLWLISKYSLKEVW